MNTDIDTGTSFQEYRIYDLSNGQQVAADLLPPNRDAAFWVWLDGDIRFHYTDYKQDQRMGNYYPYPLNGWLVDIPNHLITDVLSLPAAQQSAVFAQVDEAFRRLDREMARTENVSPNRRFVTNVTSIWEYLGPARGRGPLRNEVNAGNAGFCMFGWKADSSGGYFPDHDGGRRNTRGGPLRFLPVEPIK